MRTHLHARRRAPTYTPPPSPAAAPPANHPPVAAEVGRESILSTGKNEVLFLRALEEAPVVTLRPRESPIAPPTPTPPMFTDADGDRLLLLFPEAPASGTLAIQGDGYVRYVPPYNAKPGTQVQFSMQAVDPLGARSSVVDMVVIIGA